MENEEDAEMLGDIDFSGITMKMAAEFKADGTYTTEVDKTSAETAMKQLVEKLIPALKEVFRQQMAALSEDPNAEVTDEMLDGVLSMMGVDSWEG
jgi:hypothetical protein